MMTKMKVKKHIANQLGQVAVEYVLLLVVGIMVWLLLVNGLVSRNPNSPGIIVNKWSQIIEFIGSDQVEESAPPQ